MYLTCPNCETVYAVRAAMLREGQGEVRCGTCRLIFNALDCLSDELPSSRASIQTTASSAASGDAAPALTGESAGDSSSAVEAASSAAAANSDSVAVSPFFTGLDRAGIANTLREDLERLDDTTAPVVRHTGLWLAAVLLLLTLGFQYLWFAPEDLSRRFPQLQPQVSAFCLQAGCLVRAERAPQLIRVLSRDVRAHPRYEGALLVSATFSNAATWAQPFPGLRFSLYDVNGRTIAARTFSPTQYLAGDLPAAAHMPPGQPVQVALEMLAPEEAAVSFEFSFL